MPAVVKRAWSLFALAACIAAALVFRRFVFVAYYPVVMSAAIAAGFALSLFGTPLCLVFARRMAPGGLLPDGAERYCRRLTWIWLFVMLANLAVALATVFGPRWTWFAWNCAASYAFLGTVALVEMAVRRRRFSVVFHTSGSTGQPKKIVKTFDSLAREVAYHRNALASVLAPSDGVRPLFLATIEPQHMYGILWRVLLPRAAGCEVDPEVILSPESLIAKMRGAKKVFLVTTPSFLSRFAAYADQYEIPGNCVEIVTSGALLTPEVSSAARRVFGIEPLQIFGSTETGGVASRRGDGTFKVFAPVKVSSSSDGRLVVRSPFSCESPYVMGDGVRIAADGREFELLGRRDRLVKIAEQRVSLPEMEEKVRALPGVRDCALVALESARGPVLGAVIAGAERKPLEMRAALLPLFPKGAVPRRFRFVDDLPRNPQGKVQAAKLKELFDGRD